MLWWIHHYLSPLPPSPPCLEQRDKFAQLTTSVSLEHLDFAPDPSGKWRALKWREGVKPSRRSRAADNRPAQTNRRPPPGLNGRWRALLPGRRSLGQGHEGPHNILHISFTTFVFLFISLERYSMQHKCQPIHVAFDLWVRGKEGPRKKSKRSPQIKCFWLSLKSRKSHQTQCKRLCKILWIRISIIY